MFVRKILELLLELFARREIVEIENLCVSEAAVALLQTKSTKFCTSDMLVGLFVFLS